MKKLQLLSSHFNINIRSFKATREREPCKQRWLFLIQERGGKEAWREFGSVPGRRQELRDPKDGRGEGEEGKSWGCLPRQRGRVHSDHVGQRVQDVLEQSGWSVPHSRRGRTHEGDEERRSRGVRGQAEVRF